MLSQIAIAKSGTDWIKFKPGINIKSGDVFSIYNSFFGLRNSTDNMKLMRSETDKLSYSHHRFQQYYKGIQVEGAEYILHEFNGSAQTGNGKLINGLNLNVQPSISSTFAIDRAIAFVNADKYKWQDTKAEAFLKEITDDPSATYYPNPELVIADKDYGRDASKYRLVYKMEIYATEPLSRLEVFVDANTGEIYHSINMLFDTDKAARAATQYNGTQDITADSVSEGVYRLREAGRGKGIITYSLNNTMNYSKATDITAATLLFTKDKIANEAHWGAERTYDYYFNKFGRNSYDDKGAALASYVHYGSGYLNAFWDGKQMTYGDGGSGYGPFVALDVCAHEITHAVSGYTANFIYQNEPGALSEFFSDIFGTAVEFYSEASPNWTIGEDISSTPLRSLSNPKLYQQPTTYKGQYWTTGSEDYGGVHQNCSVGDYWFYMLSMGKAGKNDKGYYYDVAGIGMESSEKIAYRAMANYLTANSGYIDAYFATLQAAADLFGICSPEYKQTALAWYAAGVGYPLSVHNIYLANITSPVTACGLDTVNIGLNLYYPGCDSILHSGEKVVLAYKMDTNSLVYDTLTLLNDMNGGDSLQFTFKMPANVSLVGKHNLSCWVKLGVDSTVFNDSIMNYQFTNILHQNVDVGMVGVLSPVSGCGLSAGETVTARFSFYGCDSIPKGDTIALSYKINNNNPVIENYILPKTIYPRNVLAYTFSTPADLTDIKGIIKIQAKTQFVKDTFNTNDATNFTLVNPISVAGKTVTFDEANASSYFYITTTGYSHAYLSGLARYTGKYGFLMTGGNINNFYKNLHLTDSTNTWKKNANLSAKITFCVDATSWKHVNMKFNLKQTHGGSIYTLYQGDGDYTKASNLRILANDKQIGGTYNPVTDNKDPWKRYFVKLDSFAGSKFSLTFETRCVSKDTTLFGHLNKMDNAYIDDITFSEESQESINDIEINKFQAELYPSPAKDWYSINMQSEAYQNMHFETFDMYGRLVYNEEKKAYAGNNKFVFNSLELSQGIYLIRMTGRSSTQTLRMVKE